MKTTKTKKKKMLWLTNNKEMFCTTLVIMGLLLGLNHGLKAQENTKYGTDALKSNTIGIYNAAFGYRALYSNTAGYDNTANGYQVLYSNTTGWRNTANGISALYSNTTGSGNTANGCAALYSNTTGNYNTALGYYANVAYGNLTNATAIGANAKAIASNTMQLGDSAVTKVYAGTATNATLIAGTLQTTSGAINTANSPVLTIEVNNEKAGRIDANLLWLPSWQCPHHRRLQYSQWLPSPLR